MAEIKVLFVRPVVRNEESFHVKGEVVAFNDKSKEDKDLLTAFLAAGAIVPPEPVNLERVFFEIRKTEKPEYHETLLAALAEAPECARSIAIKCKKKDGKGFPGKVPAELQSIIDKLPKE